MSVAGARVATPVAVVEAASLMAEIGWCP